MFRQWERDRSLALLPLIHDLLNEPPPLHTHTHAHTQMCVSVFFMQHQPLTVLCNMWKLGQFHVKFCRQVSKAAVRGQKESSDVSVLCHPMFCSAHVIGHKPDIAPGICKRFWKLWFSLSVGAAKCCQLEGLEPEHLIWLGSAQFEGLVNVLSPSFFPWWHLIFNFRKWLYSSLKSTKFPSGQWMVIKGSCNSYSLLLSVVLMLWLSGVFSDRWIMKLNKVKRTAELNCCSIQHPQNEQKSILKS